MDINIKQSKPSAAANAGHSRAVPTENYEKLLSAAMIEFCEKGYDKASTAEICRNSGVSKGLLFHHFKSKRELYLHILNNIMNELVGAIPVMGTRVADTIYDTIIVYEKAKMAYISKKPREYLILCDAFLKTPPVLREDINKLYRLAGSDYYPKVFTGLPLADGVDRKKLFELILLVSQALAQRFAEQTLTDENGGGIIDMDALDAAVAEGNEYYRLLLKGLEK